MTSKQLAADHAVLLLQMEMALKGRTRSFSDEIRLHEEMEAAFKDFGIACRREVPVQGGGFADFVLNDWCVVEVKANGGGGMPAVRQIMRYLEDERFLGGILVCTRKITLPVDHYVKPDGLIAPLGKLELWGNAL